MAKKPGWSVLKNFSHKKLANNLDEIMAENLNDIGNWINKSIQDGLRSGKDINDKSFAPLSTKSTTILRPSGKPLMGSKRSENLRKTKKIPATKKNLEFIIEATGKSQATLPTLGGKKVKRKKAGQIYGAYHNEGYTTSSKSAIPNKEVPKREWFGIPKSALPKGKNYEKASLNRRLRIQKAIRTMLK
tara:strand:+ start:9934 stop:10497 length:564 start_codon:yes stop_codon:yes gene_type:complete